MVLRINTLKSYLITTKEILNSLKKNGLNANFIKVVLRAFIKIKELFSFDQNRLNKSFELFNFDFRKEIYENNSFKIIRSLDFLNLKKILFFQE